MADNSIYRGDDTAAFGNNFITITVKNPKLYQISKLVVTTNSGVCIPDKVFTDADFFAREDINLFVNYTSSETLKLNNGANVVKLAAYDMNGLQQTCPQSKTFYAQNGVICKNARPCC